MRKFLRLVLSVWTLTLVAVAFQNDFSQAAGVSDAKRDRTVHKQTPRVMRFSGIVADGAGSPRTGAVTLTFALYGEAQGASPVWVETQNVTLDVNGRYTAQLGAVSGEGLPVALFAHGEARWLGVRVAEEGAAEQVRVQLVSVPYALAAADAQSLAGRPATDFQLTRAASTADGQAPGPVDSAPINNGSTNGTPNSLSKFEGASTLVDSAMVEVGGRIGLGTTTPFFQMDIQNNDATAAGANLFRVRSPSANGATMHFISTSANGRHWGFGSNFILGNGEFGIYDYTAGANRLFIDSAGRVGLGTTSPSFGLDIRNNDASAAGAALMSLQTPSVNGALIRFTSTSANGRDYGFGSNFILGTGEFGIYDYTANTSRLMIAGSGNIGIGTSSPSQKLEVAGTIYSSSGGFRFPDNTVQTTAATGGGAGDITAVTAGTGLTGGGLSGDVSLAVNPAMVQSRVTGTCGAGTYVRIIAQDGSVTCGTDASGSGGVTSITAGQGLVGSPNPITTTGTLSANLTSAGGDGGSAATVARGDHLHDGRYVQMNPQSFTYSNASVNGRYAFTEFGAFSNNGIYVFSGHGSVQTNGNGQITSGTLTESSSFGYTCTFSLSGSYSVGSTGQGSVSLTATAVSGGCPNASSSFIVQVTQQGASLLLSEASAGSWTSLVALKQ